VVSLHGATGTGTSQQQISGLDDGADPAVTPEGTSDPSATNNPAPDASSPAVPEGPTPDPQSIPPEVQALLASDESVRSAAEVTSLGAREGFIAVFPQGSGELPLTFWDINSGSSDVRFVNTVIDALHTAGCGNPATTSINGFSNGAMLLSRMLCEPPPLTFSAAAMNGGALVPRERCAPPPEVDVLVIHGTADTIVPFDGTNTPTLEWLGAGTDTAPVDRVTTSQRWATAKDCPSPGWTEPGPATVVDFSCFRSTTQAVVYPGNGHAWNSSTTNTSELIWATFRPDQPCVAAPLGGPNPALERALTDALARDVVFRVKFARMIDERLTCDVPFRLTIESALRRTMVADPNGVVAQKIRFAIADELRVEPDGDLARRMREALRG